MFGDCLERMNEIPDGSVDMVLCDPPFGTTQCKWDTIIPLKRHVLTEKGFVLYEDEFLLRSVRQGYSYEESKQYFKEHSIGGMWDHLNRILKPKGVAVIFGCQPFTTTLISSNLKMFKHEWIYEKTNPKGFLNAKRMPLTSHENILIFSRGGHYYCPQKWSMPENLVTKRKHMTAKTSGQSYGSSAPVKYEDTGERHPTTVVGFSNYIGQKGGYGPNQKPVDLGEYLIETYTEKGQTVLDPCTGSGSFLIAATNTGRKSIGIENDKPQFEIARKRIEENSRQLALL